MSCKEKIILEFAVNVVGGMVSAENLKSRKNFNSYTLSTIRKNLSLLKKEKFLMIGFRRMGRHSGHRGLNGRHEYIRGVCYYKLTY